MAVQIAFRDSGDLKRLARDLRDVADGRELRKELTDGLRGVLRPLVPQVRTAYRNAASRGRSGRRGPPLRTLLAAATRMEVRTAGKQAGARLRVDGRKMPSGLKSLPQMWEGEKRWRHPLFGDRDTWIQQPARPVFYRVVSPHADDALRAIDNVLNDVRRKLERGRP